jgi:hypothetical protein
MTLVIQGSLATAGRSWLCRFQKLGYLTVPGLELYNEPMRWKMTRTLCCTNA